jgi:hypothetical protein
LHRYGIDNLPGRVAAAVIGDCRALVSYQFAVSPELKAALFILA